MSEQSCERSRCRRGRVGVRLVAVLALVAAGVVVPAGVSGGDPLYPSNDCALGTTLVAGFVGDTHVLLATVSGGPTATWVCVAADDGTTHVGGKLVVDTTAPAVPEVDDAFDACEGDPDNERLREMEIGPDEEPLVIDLTVRSDEVWLCVQATTQVAKRVVVPASVGSSTFLPDSMVPFPYPETPGPLGEPSSTCQGALTGTVTRLLNVEMLGTHVWLYTWEESAARAHVCVRVEGAENGGGRLSGDADGGQSFVTGDASSDFSPCDVEVVSDSGTPSYDVRISDPAGGSPAWMCVEVNGTHQRFTVDAGGDQGVVGFEPDND